VILGSTLVAVASRVPFGDDPALERGLVEIVDRVLSGQLWLWPAALLTAGIGVLHALGPGHGKALVGAYLLGGRGRARDAVALGVLVATMHTVSVLVVGVVLVTTQRASIGPTVESAIRIGAAGAVLVVGLAMLRRAHRHARVPAHDHHHHVPVDPVPPLSRAGIAAIATAGGLLPSPAAVIVLLTALALGRPFVGVVLVLTFGLGLAATLTAIGLLVLRGRAAVDRADARPWLRRLTAALPLLSAVAVTAGGALLLVAAVVG
jgi:nickel/cobalt transporter (NicO) family protein